MVVMSTVEQIKAAIEKLSATERSRLEQMLHGDTDDAWDIEMKADAAAGKLDALIKDVDEEIDTGKLRELP
jgi:hypothetical protein